MTELRPPVAPERRLELSEAAAPAAFVFPHAFKTLIVTDPLPDLSPAYFLAQYDPDAVADWTRILAKQFPARVLVPFAKDDASDDVYCFDGGDTSGNPIVQLIHSFTQPGWEYRGEWDNFESWLSKTIEWHDELSDEGSLPND
jgi:hypothetical protein